MDEVEAAQVLHNLRHSSVPTSSTPSSIHSASSPPPEFISRVSSIPIVHSAIQIYEQSKQNNRVVRYGAEMMESSVRMVSGPVIERMGGGDKLDEMACKYLDRLGVSNNNAEDVVMMETDGSQDAYSTPLACHTPNTQSSSEEQQQGAAWGRWQQVLVATGTMTTTTVAALSEEGMKSLRMCLEWLTFAVRHIERQIQLLRHLIFTLTSASKTVSTTVVITPLQNTGAALVAIRREVVETLRKVVAVMGKYAGACLPQGEARNAVRNFILGLPARWAQLNSELNQQQQQHASGYASVGSNGTAASTAGPGTPNEGAPVSDEESAKRILILATESLLTLQNVQGVFEGSVQNAQAINSKLAWMGVRSSDASDAMSE